MTDDLAELLTDSRPQRPPEAEDLYASHSRAMARDVVHHERTRAARRRGRLLSRKRLIGITAAVAVAAPATAWASGFLAQTGWFGAPGMTENDTSEFIDICATDFPQYFQTRIPTPSDEPPSGWTWQEVGADIVATTQRANAADCAESGVVEQVTGLQSRYYWWAEATWACRAIEAHEAGDEAALKSNAAKAGTMLERLDALGVLGGDWSDIKTAYRDGDVEVIAQFHDGDPLLGGCR